MKLLLMKYVAIAALLIVASVKAEEEKENVVVEPTTESTPMADMASTEDTLKAVYKLENATIKSSSIESQPHTIADFIIQPLIALRPRVTESENGKQSNAGNSTVSFPWQIFNFSPGQSIGSSVSSLAGTVTGWLGNRIQLPSFIETPIREAEITKTTTTSTPRPEIIVRIQQRPSAKRPLNSISNSQNHSNRQRKKSKRPIVSHVDDPMENEDAVSENYNRKRVNRRRYQEYEENYDDEDVENVSNEYLENVDTEMEEEDRNRIRQQVDEEEGEQEEEEEEEVIKPVRLQNKKQAMIYNQRRRLNNQQRRQQLQQEENDAAAAQYNETNDDYDEEEDYNGFQNEISMIQHSQIGQFNRPQSILLIKRNGQTFYLAPEKFMKPQASSYPQTPKPHDSKPQSTSQYITIPWSQLGISASEKLKPNLLTNKKKSSSTGNIVPLVAEASAMDILPPAQLHTAHKLTQKPFAKRPANVMEMALAEEDANEKEDSDEQMEEDSKSQTQYFIIADESAAKTMNHRTYKQILNYFNKNRKGRQFLLSADTKEHLIPVKILTSEEKPSKTEDFANTKLPMTAQSQLDNPPKTEKEKVKALIEPYNS